MVQSGSFTSFVLIVFYACLPCWRCAFNRASRPCLHLLLRPACLRVCDHVGCTSSTAPALAQGFRFPGKQRMQILVEDDNANLENAHAEMEEKHGANSSNPGSPEQSKPELDIQRATVALPHPEMEIEMPKGSRGDALHEETDFLSLDGRQRAGQQKQHHSQDSRPFDEVKADLERMADVDKLQRLECQTVTLPAENFEILVHRQEELKNPRPIDDKHPEEMGKIFRGKKHQEDLQNLPPADVLHQEHMTKRLDLEQDEQALLSPGLVDDFHLMQGEDLVFQRQYETLPCGAGNAKSMTPKIGGMESKHRFKNSQDCRLADDTYIQKIENFTAQQRLEDSQEGQSLGAEQLLEELRHSCTTSETQGQATESLETQQECDHPENADGMEVEEMMGTHARQLRKHLRNADPDDDDEKREVKTEDLVIKQQLESLQGTTSAEEACVHLKEHLNTQQHELKDPKEAAPAPRIHANRVGGSDPKQRLDSNNLGLAPSMHARGLEGLDEQQMQQDDDRQDDWLGDDRIPRREHNVDMRQPHAEPKNSSPSDPSPTEGEVSLQGMLKRPKVEYHENEHHEVGSLDYESLTASCKRKELLNPTIAVDDGSTSKDFRTNMELSRDGSRCPPLDLLHSLRTHEPTEESRSSSSRLEDIKLEKHGDLLGISKDAETKAHPKACQERLSLNLDEVDPAKINQQKACLSADSASRGQESSAAARVQTKSMSWPASEITRQLLATSIFRQQRSTSSSAAAMPSLGDMIAMQQEGDFDEVMVGSLPGSDPKAQNLQMGHAPVELNDLGGFEEVAAALHALPSSQGNEESLLHIPDSNRSSAFTGKSDVCDDLAEAVTTLLPGTSTGTFYAAKSLSSESKNCEHLQHANNSGSEEASRTNSLDSERQVAITSRIRADIMSHSIFPEMLAAHGACLRVTIPESHMLGVAEQLIRSQELLRAYSAFAPGHEEKADLGHKEQLDMFMRSHTDALWDLHAQLEDSVSLQVKDTLHSIARVESETGKLFCVGRLQDFDNTIESEIKRTTHSQVTMDPTGDEFGPIVPMGSEHSIMKAIRAQLKLQYGQEGFWRKITEVRDEIVRKRRAGKLPTGTTAILKEWWNQHIEWPYPTEEDKERFMEETGLELKQINNWFINQRKRNWNSGPSSSRSNERRNKPRA